MSRLFAALCVFGLLLAGEGASRADSQHFQPEKITKTARGCTISFCVKPDRHKVMRVVIGDQVGNKANNDDYTKRVVVKPYAIRTLPAKRFDAQTVHTIDLEYGDGLEAGGTYDLVTAWNLDQPQEGQAAEHVWGMSRSYLKGVLITLP